MMTREQLEKIAADCGVKVSYAESGKGGFILDSTGMKYESLSDVVMECYELSNKNKKRYSVSDENIFLAA